MSKYGVDLGHCLPGIDGGAVGIRKEEDLIKAVGLKVIEYMGIMGHTVTNCTPLTATSTLNSLYLRVTVANRDAVELFVSIHWNIGGGRGVECLYISQKDLAQKVCDEIAKLGFYNRGAKQRSDLYVLRNTDMPAILIECGFLDSVEDMNLYDSVGPDAIAKAIVRAITGKEPREPKYYVRTQNFTGSYIEVLSYKNKYFEICERLYVNFPPASPSAAYFETQYLSKAQCLDIIEKLSKDNLTGYIIEE